MIETLERILERSFPPSELQFLRRQAETRRRVTQKPETRFTGASLHPSRFVIDAKRAGGTCGKAFFLPNFEGGECGAWKTKISQRGQRVILLAQKTEASPYALSILPLGTPAPLG